MRKVPRPSLGMLMPCVFRLSMKCTPDESWPAGRASDGRRSIRLFGNGKDAAGTATIAWQRQDGQSRSVSAATRRSAFPVADAARSARPGLNPRVHGLRVERITVAVRKPRTRGAARRCRSGASDLARGNMHPFGGARLRRLALRLNRDRRELARRAQPFRRHDRLGQIEAEIFVWLV